MLVDSELFFQAIIKPVLLRFSNDPYSLSSKELELLKWYSKTFVQRIELELSRLDEIIFSIEVVEPPQTITKILLKFRRSCILM